jgi:hypothetical protein
MMSRTLFILLFTLVSSLSLADTPALDQKNLSSTKQAYKTEFLATLSQLMGKQIDPNDPKAIQAAEAFFAVDAAKSYAFTRIHGVALEFCPDDAALKEAMARYKNAAKVLIALGEMYYANGFDFLVGDQKMAKSGRELTEALNAMLEGIREEYRNADPQDVQKKCYESTNALTALADFYSGADAPPQ